MPDIERLKHLSDILKNVKPKNFDLSNWHCGTTACAVGHACMDPVFNKQGLRFLKSYPYTPTYKGIYSWGAVEEFFGLSEEQAEHLFAAGEYSMEDWGNPEAVRERIEELISHA